MKTDIEWLGFPLTICGDEHNRNETLAKTSELYGILERLGNPVIHMGDIFHTKEKLSSKTLNHVYNLLKSSKLLHILLTGNHDYHSLECREHSLEILKDLGNVIVIDKKTTAKVGKLGQEKTAVFLPYVHDLNHFKALISGPGEDLLFIHQGITGYDYGNGFIAQDEVDSRILAKYSKVISGHFHKYQQSGNLTYIGTPYSNDFGESNQIKYLGILKEDLSMDLIETPFPGHYTTEINLEGPWDSSIQFKPGYNRIILTGKKEDIELFPKDKYPGVKFIDRPTSIVTGLEFTDKLSNEAKFQLWAKDRIDEDTQKLGLEILTGVK